MRADDMARLLTSLEVAAEVIEAIDNPEIQVRRGWDLGCWTYDCIPWGIRLLRHDEHMRVTAALVAVSLPAEQRAALPVAYLHAPWPIQLLMLGSRR